MPLVIFEGPEAAGKSTLIDALIERWGSNFHYRHWGPRESWLEYCQPLFDDVKATREDPHLLVVWSRSWLSRAVYNQLLTQGHSVPKTVLKELDHIVVRSGGFLFLVTSPVNVLLQRRLDRLSDPNSKPDHPLDPEKEQDEFFKQNSSRKWKMLSGVQPVNDNLTFILDQIAHRNPEALMGIEGRELPIVEP